jgi:transposase-like protein
MTTTERDELIKQQLLSHVTYTHVAKAHGLSRQTVYALAKRMGVESPDAYSARILASWATAPAAKPKAEGIMANWGAPVPKAATMTHTDTAAYISNLFAGDE